MKQPDIQIENHGSLVLIRPLTPETIAYLSSIVQPDSQWFGDALVVELRYAGDIIAHLVNDTNYFVEYPQ